MRWHQLNEAGDTEKGYSIVNEIPEKYRRIVKEYITMSESYVYRGMKDTGTIIFGDGTKMSRKSKNTTNYYTYIVDRILRRQWEKFPLRSESFICTTHESTAGSYGTVYVVIPLENQDFGVAPSDDFWYAFDETLEQIISNGSLHYFNQILGRLYYILKKKEIMAASADSFFNSMAILSQAIKKTNYDYDSFPSTSDDLQTFQDEFALYKYFKEAGDVQKGLAQIFDPVKNKFSLSKHPDDHDSEVWISGKVMFIRYESIEEIDWDSL
ncbi:hypothetical protein FDI40_gp059 [Agrobacterium phage Atu_ph07]|uniref:Uncharacterized protein n=1 Tax=Agrobacterium phage Atu_ph07 TaxID=2024264 RepID=A0A2L0UZB6_9CAUD|nr:hypothetical protein FDI40_gp059 [Agrobacterium phage Atu_ph07]AUZ94871.1 hypothetical protein [Agrobacterium phage Atu_ph07]